MAFTQNYLQALLLGVNRMDLIKSKQRVSEHGEVFTPEWLVDSMLDLGVCRTLHKF